MKSKSTLTVVMMLCGLFADGAAAQPAVDRKATSSDAARIAAQQICPVSGLKLGEHGPPLKVKIGQQEMYLCCQACKTGKVKKAHWARIHKNFAAAQKVCVVMDNALSKKPEWTIVKGRLFYVCCQPCIDKIKSDPASYTKKLDEKYVAHAKRQATRSQALSP